MPAEKGIPKPTRNPFAFSIVVKGIQWVDTDDTMVFEDSFPVRAFQSFALENA